MSIALFAAIVELIVLLFYPFNTFYFSDSKGITFLEYVVSLSKLDSNDYSFEELIARNYSCSDSTAETIAMLFMVIMIILLAFALISVVLAFARKARAAGTSKVIGNSLVIILIAVITFLICNGDSVNAGIGHFFMPEFIVFLALSTAVSVLCIVNPDASLGARAIAPTAPNMMAAPMQRNAYPQVSAAPVRQPVYNAPAPAPAPVPAPAPTPVPAPTPSAISATYTCPVCGTTQKSDLAFCTFCGNANPNR